MLSVSLRQLEYAVAVARQGGMTAAAEVLHVSQPALSVALAQLEAQLGRALFLRRAGGPIVPTSFGREFLERAEAQLLAIAALMADQGAPLLPVRLAVFEDLAPLVLAPLLVRFGIGVVPQVMGFEDLAVALRRGQIDVALSWDLGFDAGIARQEVARVQPHAVLAADHPFATRESITMAELATQDIILADQGLSLGHMQALFHQRGLVARIAHRTASLDLMRSFAANGLGVGLSYTRPAPRLSADGRALITLPISDAGPGAPVVVAHLAGQPLSTRAEALRADLAALPQILP